MKLRLLLALALLGLAGCSTFEKRAEEKSAVFNQLDADTKAKLRSGVIEIGNTPDMVYIAIGKPDSKTEQITADKRKETWIYNAYYSDYQGTANAGYRRVVHYDSITGKYFVFFEPVRVDIYQDRIEDRIRVTFTDGKVSVIEQAK